MKLFFIKIIILSAFVIGSLLAVNILGKYDKNNYIYAISDKYDKAKQMPSPKLICIGGSSLAFGIDSKVLQDSLHIPVVNMGLEADLGISFLLTETEMVAQKDDVVIWSFEYFPTEEKAIDGEDYYKAIAYNAFPSIFNFLTFKNKMDFLRLKYLYFLRDKTLATLHNRTMKTIVKDSNKFNYQRKGFNAYGDETFHITQPPQDTILWGNTLLPVHNSHNEITMINECADRLKKQGIKIYFLFPCCAKSMADKNKDMLKDYENQLRKGLNITLLNSVVEMTYPDNLFYDTVFHLNKNGRQLYTRKVLEMLRKFMFLQT